MNLSNKNPSLPFRTSTKIDILAYNNLKTPFRSQQQNLLFSNQFKNLKKIQMPKKKNKK